MNMEMRKNTTCFLAAAEPGALQSTIEALKECDQVRGIFVVSAENPNVGGVGWIEAPSITATSAIRAISHHAEEAYTTIYTKTGPLRLGQNALERMLQMATDSKAGMVYSDYFQLKSGEKSPKPTIEYQEGSLRDDFSFGSLLVFNTRVLQDATQSISRDYHFAALYHLRLAVSRIHRIVRVPEFLYTEEEIDMRQSGQKMFDYVDPKNQQAQIEMEQVCTDHLKATGAYLEPRFRKIVFDQDDYPVEASVIIPVRNRKKTIGDAIGSVLSQKASFNFNLIIVDNFSTDGTGEIIKSIADKDDRVLHIIPKRRDLGIGGCWNVGVANENCGRFSIQLDSDDLYIDENVISRIVGAFYEQKCAMVVGSYQMVNFNLEEIPPGLIDHKEWTPENGRNNALRINGLGAPRAFYTRVLRNVKVPNTSYGEDYALGLYISRHYQIGRIYEPLYLCRRWEENSDAALDITKLNAHNFYKDKIRTVEFWARQQYVKAGQPV
jgi:hypothetical protein